MHTSWNESLSTMHWALRCQQNSYACCGVLYFYDYSDEVQRSSCWYFVFPCQKAHLEHHIRHLQLWVENKVCGGIIHKCLCNLVCFRYKIMYYFLSLFMIVQACRFLGKTALWGKNGIECKADTADIWEIVWDWIIFSKIWTERQLGMFLLLSFTLPITQGSYSSFSVLPFKTRGFSTTIGIIMNHCIMWLFLSCESWMFTGIYTVKWVNQFTLTEYILLFEWIMLSLVFFLFPPLFCPVAILMIQYTKI